MPDLEDTGSTDGSSHHGLQEQESEISMAHQVQLISGHNKWEWAFVAVSLVNIVVVITWSCVAINQCIANDNYLHQAHFAVETLTCFCASLASLFCIYGVLSEHRYDIYLHLWLMLTAIFCSGIGFSLSFGCSTVARGASISIICILFFIGTLLAQKATHALDWIEFRIVGVSAALTEMYRQVCFFLALLKFDAIFMLIVSLFSAKIIFNFNFNDWLFYQGIVIIYAFVVWLMAKVSVIREEKCLSLGFAVLNLAFLGFLIYQVYKASIVVGKVDVQIPRVLYYSSIALCSAEVLIKAFSVTWMKKACSNFGHDLNSESFQDLVSRNSTSLLARSRSNLVF